MKCPSCNRFAPYDTSSEPEGDLQFEDEVITGTVRIVLTSECCGDELKEFNFDVEYPVSLDDILGQIETQAKAKEITLPEDFKTWKIGEENAQLICDGSVDFSGEITERTDTTKTDAKGVVKTIPPRSRKTYYGFNGTAEFTVVAAALGKHNDGGRFIIPVEMSDEIQSSSMDEMV